MRRLMDRIRNDCAELLRGELAGLRRSMDDSLSAAVIDLRHDLDEQRIASQERGLAERDDLAVVLVRLARALEDFTATLDAERHRSSTSPS